ncbi:MAG: dUTP diphosphatase [Nitrospiraceae bacterium]|nr:dUTP diphosphatase [Nitrospiraceae bacterium]
MVEVRFVRLNASAVLPSYARSGDAACDLVAAEAAKIPPLGRATVGTGIAIEIPPGYAGFVLPRSGLASRYGLTLANAPGLIDSGYRGELRVALFNADPEQPFSVTPGDRIAQFLVMPVPVITWTEVEALSESGRGEGGFGSTGVS